MFVIRYGDPTEKTSFDIDYNGWLKQNGYKQLPVFTHSTTDDEFLLFEGKSEKLAVYTHSQSGDFLYYDIPSWDDALNLFKKFAQQTSIEK
ncbi:hypothetical protein WA1_44760 [Scytonema hofmannii PCC 7110]|uniref:Uncharacterized protein n=2 Tax=Scytonema hofmannii TaxID=34078 RepID=A0A139WWH5_9CYAN|nr:hypothetical protein WA1_44760 [Scytonema hofmannii PCC 7110]